MKKRIFVTLAALCLNTTVSATASNAITPDLTKRNPQEWCLNHDLSNGATCAAGWITVVPQSAPLTFTLYVKPFLANTSILSDPVILECKDMSFVIRGGSFATCSLPVSSLARWQINPINLRNGADGIIFYS